MNEIRLRKPLNESFKRFQRLPDWPVNEPAQPKQFASIENSDGGEAIENSLEKICLQLPSRIGPVQVRAE